MANEDKLNAIRSKIKARPAYKNRSILDVMPEAEREMLLEIAREWAAGKYGQGLVAIHEVVCEELGFEGSEPTLRRIFQKVKRGQL